MYTLVVNKKFIFIHERRVTMAINPVEMDTTTTDKVTAKPNKQSSAWNNKQLWLLPVIIIALAAFVYFVVFA